MPINVMPGSVGQPEGRTDDQPRGSIQGPMESRQVTRFGLIGLGRWGRRLAAVLEREGHLSLCCSTADGQGREWALANLPDVPWTADPDELIASGQVDAVAIATPLSTHASFAERALSGGKHVFVEKPFATDRATADELHRLAGVSTGILMTDHTFLFDANMTVLADVLRHDAPRQVSMSWAKWGTFEEPMLWSLFPHDIAISLALFRDVPQNIEVTTDPSDRQCHRSSVTLTYPEGQTAEIAIDRTAASRAKEIRVSTETGREYVWRDGQLFGAQHDPHVPLQHAGPPTPLGPRSSLTLLRPTGAPPLSNAIRYFTDATRNRPGVIRSDSAFSVQVTKILSDIRELSG